ncbi:sulfatase [Streptomyces sp. NBC_00513]|uniref:sulfatase family protein n=1 Tax=unclassified Streptomyces TaxID=2593676 RepID=UPI0022590882|nr:sulfatase [Streptomyces sp. NBC_00424]MCX5072411.1 sulfatase [Streptomyces sp. NBC_00424]WUD44248.1 sulfatase [Streptomyces sp. NBC_00513]
MSEQHTSGPRNSPVGRRGFLAGAAAVAAAAATPALARDAAASPAAARPNILLIVTDDQPKQTDWAIPKTIEWLGGHGVTFTHGHAATPLCAPSRSSIFSGRHAHHHGVRNNSASYSLDQSTTVQRHLKQAGYRTGLFGKYLNSWTLADDPPHFEEFALLQPGYNDARWNVDGTVQQLPGYTTNIVKNRTLAFLDKSTTDSRPWFAYVTPYASHAPNTPAPKYTETPVPAWNGRPSVPEDDRSDKPAYIRDATSTLDDGRETRKRQLRSLLSVDDAVRAIHDKLVALGQLENTLVVFTGDNGYTWADHGWTKKSVPYSPAHEVPFYLSWPAGGLGGGTKDHRIVANIDIAPTILDAAGVARPAGQDGRSLLGSESRDHLLVQWWKKGTGAEGPKSWASYVAKDKQYTEYYDLHTDATGAVSGTGQVTFREYYDLAADPYQLKNLLYQATPAQEQALGVPALAARLAADRAG